MKLFGSSGIRGPFGKTIIPQLVNEIGQATGTVYSSVVVGWDPRTTSELLSNALVSGLMAVGARVGIAGMVTTPTLAHATKNFKAGLMITASHNPPADNGVKFWNPDGSSFGSEQMLELENILEENRINKMSWDAVGTSFPVEDAIEQHIKTITDKIGPLSGKVVVDCGNGATSNITPYVLKELGCEVITLNAQPDGSFPGRSSEPSAENTGLLSECVKESGAILGIAHDGDGDRMLAVDETGRFNNGDVLLPIFAKKVGKKGIVPINVSMGVDKYIDGIDVVRCKVGDVYVAEKMKEVGAEFGGEESGTWIFTENSYCPDGVFAAARLVQIVQAKPLSEYVDELPKFNIIRKRVPFGKKDKAEAMTELQGLMDEWNALEISDMDGLKAVFNDGWILLRPSGTEPKLKVVIEGMSEERANELFQMADEAVECVLK
jgi:phosphoglucosamine mutase